MNSIQPPHYELLKARLQNEFIPHLPELLPNSKSPEQQVLKNLSRAFSAFVLNQLNNISPAAASGAVVDDFDDKGIDAIYYNISAKTLYLIQTKFKQSEKFKEEDSLKFCRGVRDLIKPDLTNFNEHVQRRQTEIYEAVEKCTQIQLVVAHIGNGISDRAKLAINELLKDDTHGEQERFCSEFVDYNSQCVIHNLFESEAPIKIDEGLYIYKHSSISKPRVTHFGLISLVDLAELHRKYGLDLYEKNIRTFLGSKTGVNSAIRRTLATEPANFVYLNNGVTALFHSVEQGGNRLDGYKLFTFSGISIINGAQTIASAARHEVECPADDISSAVVAITLIQVSPDEDFGKAVTQARNYQNQVSAYNFAALDDEQERLRRDLSHLKIYYAYKEGNIGLRKYDPDTISLEEASHALALFHDDPRFAIWLKRDPVELRTFGSAQYKLLFSSALTAQQIVNSVRFHRLIQERLDSVVKSTANQERAVYLHGGYLLSWVLAHRIYKAQQGATLVDITNWETILSVPFDQLRLLLWEETQPLIGEKGPLAIFRSQTDTIPLLEKVLIKNYGLTDDPVLQFKRQQQNPEQPYPVDLFAYILSKAPQISNLT
ncbi:AIPR family protein [Spirosoma terrae]|uniref:Abortive phage resistance protein n=1 Tax=Spirosoma terrae TaxID=1968276 RepID=A0A6L9L485_9BACT|nr:AIPR family protein [Spirosoma terrae]NDU94232.1 abortive phage resistance protein [Spirosoma terrae]